MNQNDPFSGTRATERSATCTSFCTSNDANIAQRAHDQTDKMELLGDAAANEFIDDFSPKFRQFSCLYTRHKTQKRKVWQDGRLIVRGFTVELHDADPPFGSSDQILDCCTLCASEISGILVGNLQNDIETDKFMVRVDGPWSGKTSVPLRNYQSDVLPTSTLRVINRKFQKPPITIPRNPVEQKGQSILRKRRRPLQPGELVRRYYPTVRLHPDPPTNRHNIQNSIEFTQTMEPQIIRRQNQQSSKQIFNNSDVAGVSHRASNSYKGSSAHHAFTTDFSIPQINQNANQVVDSARSFTDDGTSPNSHSFPVAGNSRHEAAYSDDRIHSITRPSTFESPLQSNENNHRSMVRKHQTLKENSFKPFIYYGEDSDENETDDDSNPFQVQAPEIPLSHSIVTKVDQNAGGGTSVNTTISHNSSGIPTLSTEQLLDLFANPVSSKPSEKGYIRTVTVASNKSTMDEFTLPEIADSSDEE